jgi:hypothetical protein|eukprot:COSAG06_NODE_1372_length_9663_cov_5.356232_4_plen_196_part_00
MSRASRFSGDGGGIVFPEAVGNLPKCLQPGFRPTKSVKQECAEHGLPCQREHAGGDERVTALAKFTEDDAYGDINDKMRSYSHKEWENTIFQMHEGLKAMPKPRGRHPRLWRGMSGVRVKKGQTIVFKDFTSASKNRAVAEAFAKGCLMEIHTWTMGADISSLSAFPEEEEVLLAPYATFRVSDIQKGIVVLDAC